MRLLQRTSFLIFAQSRLAEIVSKKCMVLNTFPSMAFAKELEDHVGKTPVVGILMGSKLGEYC